MYIDCCLNSGKPQLRVAQSYVTKVNGVSKSRKRTVRNIGPLSHFDDGKKDYLARLRQSFREGNPLIESLKDLALANSEKSHTQAKVTITFDKNDVSSCRLQPKNIGYFFLDGLYDFLGLSEVLNKHKSRARIAYDLNGLVKLLVFGRALAPESKCETWREKDNYVFEVTSSKNLIEVYRALDVLDQKASLIQSRMHYKITQNIGRDKDICYYDVTNYYFEIDEADDDTLDQEGNLITSGLRKSGPSKVKNKKPIVQMGLFIDKNGIPISYHLFPGNNIDQTTLRPALKQSINKMGFNKVIIVADGGCNSDKNIAHVVCQGNGYILSKSTRKCTKEVKKWILNEKDYLWNQAHTFKSKSMIRQRIIKDENGHKVAIAEKLICYWSKRHYQREFKENQRFIKYLESVIAFPDKLKDHEKKIEKFLIKRQVDKTSGKEVKTKTILSINWDKVKEYFDLMGYYTLLTSQIKTPDLQIISNYRNLSRIEDSFRVIKSDLQGRPVYVNTQSHIKAHFLICFIALTMLRIIQYRLVRYQEHALKNSSSVTSATTNTVSNTASNSKIPSWRAGMSAKRIKQALNCFIADPVTTVSPTPMII